MKKTPKLIVMLTDNDLTIQNAYETFDTYKHSTAQFWGFKEKPLSLEQMKKLTAYMKSCGKTTALEVVAYNEETCLAGAKTAADCGCDILMGTLFYDSVNNLCLEKNLKYMPFVGDVTGRPSVLSGSIEEMIACANRCIEKGVYGFDLLGYRYDGDGATDATELIKRFIAEVHAPVCVAGSVNSFQRLDEIRDACPWAFTVGSAFSENAFGKTLGEQIDRVCEFMRT